MNKNGLAALILIILSCANGSVIKFQAFPDVLKTNLTSSASMRCSLANTEPSNNHGIGKKSVTKTDDDVLHISEIYVTNSNGDDVASISAFDAPIAYMNVDNLQVKGDVSGTSSEGYLELSWQNPSAIITGEYTCNIQAATHHHHPVTFSTSLEITEEAPTIKDVVIELNSVKQREQIYEKEITDLKQKLQTQKSCSSKRSGFMAAVNTGTTEVYHPGKTVIFNKVIFSEGNGYDNKTGVFTCSEPGMYSFHAGAISAQGHEVRLHLKLNSEIITSFYAYGGSEVNTASTNAVFHLQQNDMVQIVTDTIRDAYLYHDSYLIQGNVFVGQMLQSDCEFF